MKNRTPPAINDIPGFTHPSPIVPAQAFSPEPTPTPTLDREAIQEALITSSIFGDPDNLVDMSDPHLVRWMQRTRQDFISPATRVILNETIESTILPWAADALREAKLEAVGRNNAILAGAELRASAEALTFKQERLATLQAGALAATDLELASLSTNFV